MKNDANTDYQYVTLSHQGYITTLTMQRPERANALSHAHLAELEHAALSMREDSIRESSLSPVQANTFLPVRTYRTRLLLLPCP